MIRRCPQCGTTTDDVYGFCIKCGYEFPEMPKDRNTCPLCGFPNPDEADFCVKCGTPLLFKSQFEKTYSTINPNTIGAKTVESPVAGGTTSRFVIFLGYFLAILGSVLGLVISVYLMTRKDPVAKRHGYIQLAIILVYIVIIAAMFATGNIPADLLNQYQQLFAGNLTSI